MLKCKICKSTNIKIHHPTVFGLEKSRVYKCNDCQIVFLYPYLDEKEIQNLYSRYDDIIQQRSIDCNADINHLFISGLVEASQRVERFSSYIEGKMILEIGAGSGSFLSKTTELAKTITAIEPSVNHHEFIKKEINCKIYSDINQLIDYQCSFDTIFLFHVFEHISEPQSFLKTIADLLVPNGCLVMEVPHAEDALLSIYNVEEFRDYYYQVQHPFYYNEYALKSLVNDCVLEINDVIYHQRYGMENHINWVQNKEKGGNAFYKSFFSNFDILYRKHLIDNKKTDTISVVCVKPSNI